MKRTKPFILYLLIVTAFIFPCCREKKEENVMLPVRGQLLFRTDTLIRKTAQLYEISIAFGKSLEKIKPVFLDTRIAYKELEWAAEYFTPVLARRLNGPPVPELEESGISLTPPAGLQVIEGLIYSGNENNRIVLIRQIEMLQRDLAVLRSKLTSVEMQDWQVLEAIKQEIFRVETLGITGFDCPQSLNSLSESASALDGIRFALLGLQKTGTDSAVKIIGNGISFLQSQGEFKNFDRMEFILHFANPASTAIAGMAAGLSFKGWRYNLLLSSCGRLAGCRRHASSQTPWPGKKFLDVLRLTPSTVAPSPQMLREALRFASFAPHIPPQVKGGAGFVSARNSQRHCCWECVS